MSDLVEDCFEADDHPVPVRFELAGRRPEDALRDLGGVYAGRRWSASATAEPFEYRYTALGDTDLTIRRSQMHGSISGVVPAGGDYVVTWIAGGTGMLDVLGEQAPMALEAPVLFPTDQEFAFTTADYDQRLVHFDRDFVRRIAEARHPLDDRPLRFDHRRAPDPQTARRWQGALTGLARALRVGGPESPAWHEAKATTVGVFLDLFPPHTDDLPAVLGLPRNARLRAAVAHIEAHAAEPVTIQELAAASGLSVRSVQESFRRVFDVSPLTYLRHVRLDRVREELLQAAGPQAGAVGDVARRWGFAHLGRFSAAYAARFGEYPKETLRR